MVTQDNTRPFIKYIKLILIFFYSQFSVLIKKRVYMGSIYCYHIIAYAICKIYIKIIILWIKKLIGVRKTMIENINYCLCIIGTDCYCPKRFQEEEEEEKYHCNTFSNTLRPAPLSSLYLMLVYSFVSTVVYC